MRSVFIIVSSLGLIVSIYSQIPPDIGPRCGLTTVCHAGFHCCNAKLCCPLYWRCCGYRFCCPHDALDHILSFYRRIPATNSITTIHNVTKG
uniref:Cysteine rich secreted protein n=1 Tax=Riptortus pedestris TaxID=329032 RepID=R4WD07_RIPPE|nr:cysteine rich secreted protein [Riptortus pedestris]